jgi:23S rRNA pseudoU1915 N3-methylase RlmH
MCRNKTKKWLNDKIMRIEENDKKNETRKFSEGIKHTRQRGVNTPILVHGADGNIISQLNKF